MSLAEADEGFGDGKFKNWTFYLKSLLKAMEIDWRVQDVREFPFFLCEKIDVLYILIKFSCTVTS